MFRHVQHSAAGNDGGVTNWETLKGRFDRAFEKLRHSIEREIAAGRLSEAERLEPGTITPTTRFVLWQSIVRDLAAERETVEYVALAELWKDLTQASSQKPADRPV